jgi:23S rRNA pseudouridine2605 synthase
MNDKPRRPGGPGNRPTGGGKPFAKGGASKGGAGKSGEGGRFSSRPAKDAPFAKGDRLGAEVEAGERIAKRLARAGVSSRRDAEALIAAGRVAVNGRTLTSPALNVGGGDEITIDGKPIPAIERTRLFLFHKPSGLVTTNRDPEGRRTIFDALPEGLPRLITIGRLDINTEGLLLLTNDGGLARVLELPSTGWLRRYRVRVHGKVDEQALAGLKDGLAVDGVFYGAIEASLDREQGSNAWLTIGLREGKNREVKNVLGALGLDVTRLIRLSYGPFQLGELAEGAVHELKGRMLRDQLGERLIEEAGANFEAPVVAAFSNKPVAGAAPRPGERRDAADRPARMEPGEGGLIKNRKRDRENRREDALDRLQTSPSRRDAPGGFGPRAKPSGKPFPGKPAPGGRPKGREEAREQVPARSRTANVWMAPGARPQRDRQDEPDPAARREERPRNAGPGKREREAPRSRSDDRAPPRRREGAADAASPAPRGRNERPYRDKPGSAPASRGDDRTTRPAGGPERGPRQGRPAFGAGRPKGDGPGRGPRDDAGGKGAFGKGRPRDASASGPRARLPGDGPRGKAPGDGPRVRSPGDAPRGRAPGEGPRARAPGEGPRGKAPGDGPRKGSGNRPGSGPGKGPGGPRKGPPKGPSKGPPKGRGGR